MEKLSRFVDDLSNFFAARKGLLVILGILLVFINAVLQFFPQLGWLVSSNLLLHLGIILALIGIMLAWAL
jgi:uncharacterized membrane protein